MLTGPRQSGKTTLLKSIFGSFYRYLSLETPDVLALAHDDPRGFLDLHPPPVIIDEVQYAPDLLPYIKERIDKERIDARRSTVGQYLLTGSQNLLLLASVTESLAGRAAMLRLLPLSAREEDGDTAAQLPWEEPAKKAQTNFSATELWRRLLRGFYPDLAANPERSSELWHASYIQAYLERDVRSIRQVGDLSLFQAFVRALAGRCAQLLSLTGMASDLGLSLNTVKAWLSVLEASFQIILLRPYFVNVGKRMVKAPKVYFTDTGTLCYLAGLREPEHAAAGPMGGAIFESAVLAEIVKTYLHRGEEPRVWFWRTSAGSEVDFVVESGGKVVPIEVKLSATPRSGMAASIFQFQRDFGERAGSGYVVHPGNITVRLTPRVTAIPFSAL